MSSKISTKQLRAGATIVESRMLAEIDSNETSPHDFSEAFEQKMKPVLKKARRQEKALQTVRTIAASLVIVILCGIVWVAPNAEAREAVQKWFTFTWNNIISYRFNEEYTGEFPTYRPTWLPEGYEETNVFETDDYCELTYEDKNGNLIFVYYMAMDDGSDISFGFFPDEKFRKESVLIQGLQGDLYISSLEDEQSSLIWMDEKNGIVFGVDGVLDEEVILRIAESIKRGNTS